MILRIPSWAWPLVFATASSASFPWIDPYPEGKTDSKTISWTRCWGAGYECAVYHPPLDYQEPSAGNARIAMIRFKATRKPKLGSLFTNPGGPGASGVDWVMGGGPELSAYSGGYYDIVGWDPRGVKNSLPSSKCFSSDSEEFRFWLGSIRSSGVDSKGNFTDQSDLTNFYNQAQPFDASLREFGKKCKSFNPQFKYIGTAATARDIVGMADILDGPGSPISYWGVSYGTVIGSYLVNMFPNRVGRIILDSVVDPVRWSTMASHFFARNGLADSEATFNGFCEACATGAAQCALTNNGTLDTAKVKDKILKLIDNIYDASRLGFEYRSEWVRDDLFLALYSPRSWDEYAGWLAHLEEVVATFMSRQANSTLKTAGTTSITRQRWKQTLALPSESSARTTIKKRQFDDSPQQHAFEGITCVDSINPGSVTTRDVFDEIVYVTRNVTPTFGASFTIAGYYCHAFPIRAVERFTGPFNSKLVNPILIIGNKVDPITPFANAKALADGFGDSAVLIQRDGWGHSASEMLSTCVLDAISNYLIAGKLPLTGLFCQTNQPLFVEGEEPDTVETPTTITPIPVPTGSQRSGSATVGHFKGLSYIPLFLSSFFAVKAVFPNVL